MHPSQAPSPKRGRVASARRSASVMHPHPSQAPSLKRGRVASAGVPLPGSGSPSHGEPLGSEVVDMLKRVFSWLKEKKANANETQNWSMDFRCTEKAQVAGQEWYKFDFTGGLAATEEYIEAHRSDQQSGLRFPCWATPRISKLYSNKLLGTFIHSGFCN